MESHCCTILLDHVSSTNGAAREGEPSALSEGFSCSLPHISLYGAEDLPSSQAAAAGFARSTSVAIT